jgi:hypothetical protein
MKYKKCPPGVICVENISMIFILAVFAIVLYLGYNSMKQPVNINNKMSEKIIIKDKETNNGGGVPWFSNWLPSWPYTNLPSDPLLNPYAPPLRDERYFIPPITGPFIPPGTIPINISTNIGAVDTSYRQLGIVTPLNGSSKDSILPLMGRPLFTNRDKWNYYTTSNQHNNVKLPVSRNGRSCTNEYGCDRLYNGDTIYIEGINEPYKITMYDNDTIKYLPVV